MSAPALSPAAGQTYLPTGLMCSGCGYIAPPDVLPLRCPAALEGDDIDHVITRTLDVARVKWPVGGETNPFVRYRSLFHWYQVARAAGHANAEIVAEIDRLDDAIAAVDGHGFAVTPFACSDQLSLQGIDQIGGVCVKDETVNVSGSHKARHLFGTLLALHFAGDPSQASKPLAIASCGNAALAAAVVAMAASRELHVFVPVEADPIVLGRLADLGAQVTICERQADESGDPSVLRMREEIAAGALPFTCQGNENGLAIEAGLTLGYEIADQFRSGGGTPDHMFIQVGGGALASSVIQGLSEARQMGVIDALPRIHTVQTARVAPLARAYQLLAAELARGRAAPEVYAEAARHHSKYMWPWHPVALSVASGILDDETYDWLAVVRGMVETGGQPVIVDEDTLLDANYIARTTTGIDVDETGSAGLAGLLRLRQSDTVRPDEKCAVLFTGIRRHGGTP